MLNSEIPKREVILYYTSLLMFPALPVMSGPISSTSPILNNSVLSGRRAFRKIGMGRIELTAVVIAFICFCQAPTDGKY